MTRSRGRAAAVVARVGRAVRAGWRAVRHPAGWYDEVDQVYGRDTRPSGPSSAGSAGVGGLIGGGGGGV